MGIVFFPFEFSKSILLARTVAVCRNVYAIRVAEVQETVVSLLMDQLN
jgi:hypothetical protein